MHDPGDNRPVKLAALVKKLADVSCAVLRVVDDTAIAFRGPIKAMTTLGLGFQGGIITGTLKFHDGSHLPNIIAVCNIVLAYFTIRGGEHRALARADAKAADQWGAK